MSSFETNTTVPTTAVEPLTMKLYACGGAGTNLVNLFNRSRGKTLAGFAVIDSCFVDTSRSNLDPSVPESDVYLFEDVNGSGKVQGANYDAIAERHKEILNRFKPGDINVVVHSASGGSGPTIGQVIMNELLKRGEQVFAVVVGNTSSRLETENTLKVLQRYEAMATARQRPCNVFYRENTADTPRGEVDKDVHGALVMLSVLFSGQNRELDTEDTKNWLDYQTVTHFQPGLAGIELLSAKDQLRSGEVVYSMATLADEETSSEPVVPCEYQTVGFLSPKLKDSVSGKMPMHFCTIGGYFSPVVRRLEEKLVSYNETRASVVVKPIATTRLGSDFMSF